MQIRSRFAIVQWLTLGVISILIASAPSNLLAGTLQPGQIVAVDQGTAALYLVDPATGNRAILSQAGVKGSGVPISNPAELAIEPSGTLLLTDYAGIINPVVVRIDPVSGDRSIVTGGGIGSGPALQSGYGIQVDESGAIYLASQNDNAIVRIDPLTGNRSVLSSNAQTGGVLFNSPNPLAFDANGDFIVGNAVPNVLIRADFVTGARELLSGSSRGVGPQITNPSGIDLLSGGDLVVLDNIQNMLFRVDPVTGDRTTMSSALVGSGPMWDGIEHLAVDNSGHVIASSVTGAAIFEVDPFTGNRSLISSAARGSGPAFTFLRDVLVVPVPEPSGAILCSMGLGIFLAFRRYAKSVQ